MFSLYGECWVNAVSVMCMQGYECSVCMENGWVNVGVIDCKKQNTVCHVI